MTATPVRPPSTSITVPWTNAASSLARYTAAWAMASGVPLAPSGLGERMTPGEMALTPTPDGPNSAAHDLIIVSIAPLVEL